MDEEGLEAGDEVALEAMTGLNTRVCARGPAGGGCLRRSSGPRRDGRREVGDTLRLGGRRSARAGADGEEFDGFVELRGAEYYELQDPDEQPGAHHGAYGDDYHKFTTTPAATITTKESSKASAASCARTSMG